MASKDQVLIKAGLDNYVGAMLASTKFDNEKATKHSVVAVLLEIVMDLCKDKEGNYDMYVAKPALRLVSNIARQRAGILSELPQTQEILEQKTAYEFVENELNKVIENTKL